MINHCQFSDLEIGEGFTFQITRQKVEVERND